MDLSHNMLTEIPWEMGALEESLAQMNVDHNPLVVPPKVIVNKGTPAMLNWLAKNEAQGRKAKVSGLGLTNPDTK
jgi:hypothetical protein